MRFKKGGEQSIKMPAAQYQNKFYQPFQKAAGCF